MRDVEWCYWSYALRHNNVLIYAMFWRGKLPVALLPSYITRTRFHNN